MIELFYFPIDGILTSTKTADQSGPGSDNYEGVLRIPPKFMHWRPTIRYCFVSEHSAEMQSAHSTASAT